MPKAPQVLIPISLALLSVSTLSPSSSCAATRRGAGPSRRAPRPPLLPAILAADLLCPVPQAPAAHDQRPPPLLHLSSAPPPSPATKTPSTPPLLLLLLVATNRLDLTAGSSSCCSTLSSTPRSDLHRASPSTSASASHGHERHQQQVQAVPPSPLPPSCTSSPALSVGAMPLGARSRVAGVPPQRCRLEPPPRAKSRHGHHLPDALAVAARPPRGH
nr:lysine-rich arabinogalactan protein 19-like [Aegilops tauschii subsp. strangulata]